MKRTSRHSDPGRLGPDPCLLRAAIRSGSGHVTLSLSGELASDTVPEFRLLIADLLAPCDGPVILDLVEVRFLDCAGARALISVARALTSRGVPARVTGLRGEPRRLADIIGLERLI
ncbi:STAS domain-containing protein [Oryzihumus sp.]